jgi:hypothetical protein
MAFPDEAFVAVLVVILGAVLVVNLVAFHKGKLASA